MGTHVLFPISKIFKTIGFLIYIGKSTYIYFFLYLKKYLYKYQCRSVYVANYRTWNCTSLNLLCYWRKAMHGRILAANSSFFFFSLLSSSFLLCFNLWVAWAFSCLGRPIFSCIFPIIFLHGRSLPGKFCSVRVSLFLLLISNPTWGFHVTCK